MQSIRSKGRAGIYSGQSQVARFRPRHRVEVIQEFVHVRARRRDREDAAGLGRDYAELLSPLLVIDRESLREGLTLFERTESLGAFDAVLAAAAISSGAEALVSADSGFADVPNLPYVSPDVAGVATLL